MPERLSQVARTINIYNTEGFVELCCENIDTQETWSPLGCINPDCSRVVANCQTPGCANSIKSYKIPSRGHSM